MAIKFIKCNIVGQDCKHVAKAETEEAVIEEYSKHYREVHKDDPKNIMAHIKFAIRTHGEKASASH